MDKRELSVYSQAGWIELSDAFPPSTPDDAGKVLAVGEDGKPEWAEGSGGLPSTGSASEGDILSLNSSKEPVWSAPSGVGGGSIEIYIDRDNPLETQAYNAYPVKYKSDNSQVASDDIIDSPLNYYLCSVDVSGTSIFVPCKYTENQGSVAVILLTLTAGTDPITLLTVPDTSTNKLYKVEMK